MIIPVPVWGWAVSAERWLIGWWGVCTVGALGGVDSTVGASGAVGDQAGGTPSTGPSVGDDIRCSYAVWLWMTQAPDRRERKCDGVFMLITEKQFYFAYQLL